MAFSEVREYQYGDDVRDIDWNVTARFDKPFVKVFEEERELTVMLLVDVSNSLDFGTIQQLKKEMVTEIAATIAFSAIQNNDKIGVIFFPIVSRNLSLPRRVASIFCISFVNCLISSRKVSAPICSVPSST